MAESMGLLCLLGIKKYQQWVVDFDKLVFVKKVAKSVLLLEAFSELRGEGK